LQRALLVDGEIEATLATVPDAKLTLADQQIGALRDALGIVEGKREQAAARIAARQDRARAGRGRHAGGARRDRRRSTPTARPAWRSREP
jgi:hypothetical protein